MEKRYVIVNPEQALLSFQKRLMPDAIELWRRKPGSRLLMTLASEEQLKSWEQLKFYWGFLLKHISAQCRINGMGANALGWHWYFKERLLEPVERMVKLPGEDTARVVTEPPSLAGLSVRAMARYSQQVEAIAVRDFGCALPADFGLESLAEGASA